MAWQEYASLLENSELRHEGQGVQYEHPYTAVANAELILAALIALEQVGDASALPNVKRLANGKGLAAKEARVQEAARTCLLSLQERTEERISQTLRPSRAGADTLLLPAAATEETASALLLRPTSNPGGELS